MLTDTTGSTYAKVHPLPFGDATWESGLMKERTETCMTSTVPQLRRMFDSASISHIVENFKICAGQAQGSFDGTVFGDGDFYKWLEAAVYTAYTMNDTALQEDIESYIELIGKAQQPDGYLSTKQIIGEQDGTARRGGDINDFEVYNMGHLFTSACLHKRITGRDNFLRIAIKAASYLQDLYDESERTGEVRTAVCPSHYMGLIELYRTTGEQKYLDLAAQAIRLRDSVKEGLDDNQDKLPLKKHRKIIGHAVRANYLYAGLADLYLENGDAEYREVLESVWHSLVTKKIYITGGCGALYNGASPYGYFFDHQLVHQAYGYEYQLPNYTAYNETCASVGLVMWAYRMFQMDPKAEYFDMIERAFLNVNMASISLDGKKFFYENMLRRTKGLDFELIWPLTRTEYITSYCCPPNIARMLSQSAEYAYSCDAEGNLYAGLYGANSATVHDAAGHAVHISQQTDYPYDGVIKFCVQGVQNPGKLYLRIPAWCESGRILRPDGTVRPINLADAGSYVAVELPVEESSFCLTLDMPAVCMAANPMVEEDINQVAVMRGPLVYCVESPDT
ncbi:MAG: glycoside hydrolase family 127 protein, partial [Lachnospiraceae bacterium]|nr:glycoside hydrolase family 127 protein [Lachnospiraceae bacterium]